jgi:nitrate reductase / nitrite oxidoreductase, alpha subunit
MCSLTRAKASQRPAQASSLSPKALTGGVNCTGGCSWKIYVKSGVVTWETQQTDYPRTRPGMPNHKPRGCSRGASYSWYLYSASRIKYPMVARFA